MIRSIALFILISFSSILFGQESFEGVIDMTTINNEMQEKAEIRWYIKNGNHRLEYSGTKAGESYSYVFLISQGSNLMQMLSEADGKKVVYEIPKNAITNSIPASYGATMDKTDATKLISGFAAYMIKVEAPEKISTVWASEKTPLSMNDMPAILMNNSVLKEMKAKGINAIPLEITSTNTGGNLLYSQKITSIQKQSLSDDLFEVPAEYQSLKNSMDVSTQENEIQSK